MNFKSPSLQKSFTTYTLKKVKGFTLIELLIVIGILAILATIVLLVINPAQLIKQARDANRLTELNQIDKALALFESFGGTNMGLSNNVYVSIPCDQADFINLPALSPGYVYSCSSSANFRKTNGSGWLPVDLTSIQSQAGNLFSALPIDPINIVAGGLYYTYIKGSWALSAAMESERYTSANTINDGGQVSARFEMGNNLALNANINPIYAIPADGLVGYWKFDEGAGTIASDFSGNSNIGTLTNGPTWTTGQVGGAVSFDGTNDYILVLDSDSLDLTNQMSISAWVYQDSWNDTFEEFLRKENAYYLVSLKPGSWGMYLNGRIDFGLYIGGTWRSVALDNFPALSSWRYIVATYNSSVQKLYINGSEVASGAQTGVISTNTNNLLIGQIQGGGQAFKGFLDEIAIYNRALSTAEVLGIYNGQK